jgi:putative sterol carrier protein
MAMGKLKVKGKQTFLLKNMSAFSHILDVMTRLDPVYE